MTQGRKGAGFTLIELLVVIGIIGLLLSISLPALGNARGSAQRLKSMVNTKTIADTFIMVESDTGAWPTKETLNIGGGAAPLILLDHRIEGDGQVSMVRIGAPIWELSVLWPFILGEQVDVKENIESWFSPGRPVVTPGLDPETMTDDGIIPPVSYRYSNSFLANGRLWSEGGVDGGTSTESIITSVSGSDVQHPSAKTLIWDADIAYIPDATRVRNGHFDTVAPMAFADGHSDLKNPAEAREGFGNPLNGASDIRLHNTVDGVRGADY